VPLVFFSLSGSKLPGYILPALPAALILTAEYVSRFVQKSNARRISLQVLAFLTFAVVALLSQFAVTKYAGHETVKYLITEANQNGYADAKILNFHTVSHNAEFYGAGRLVRTADGKQRRFDGIGELLEELKREDKPVLVLVPLAHLKQITESDSVAAKILGDNGELAIVALSKQEETDSQDEHF